MLMKSARPLFVGLVLLFSSSYLAAKSDAVDNGYYTEKDNEFYLTADEIYFIRPGLEAKIVDFVIPDDRRPEVTFTLKDPGGLGLDTKGVTTPGEIRVRYMLAYIPMGQEQKVNYHGSGLRDPAPEGCSDSDGCPTDLGGGMYFYKFNTVLPEDFQKDATHTFTLVARRDLREWDLDRYADNAVYNFVPSGAFDPVPREIVTIETCNGRCHDPLAMHGGSYVDTQVCTQCHNPGLRDKGNYVSFNVMIHRVHEEAHSYPAPLNECEACHTGGTPTANFPLVASPNPVPVCDFSGLGKTELTWNFPSKHEIRVGSPTGSLVGAPTGKGSKMTGKWIKDNTEFFVIDPTTGKTVQQLGVDNTVLGCQGNAPGTFRGTAGLQHTNWLDHPSRDVCGACHTDVNFETGEGHSEFGFPVDNDEICSACHVPTKGVEFDRSIMGAHLETYKSSAMPGLIVEIIDVMDTDPGDFPTVVFDVGGKSGKYDANELDRLRLTITGPNEDFSFRVQENVVGNSVRMGEYWAYTFETALPDDAQGSYTVSTEGRNNVELIIHGEASTERDALQATLFPFAVTDATAMARRQVVDDYNCESCHTNLALHGGGRTNAEYCNTCHRPDFIAVLEPQESVHFKYMVHKIHRGAELENGYVVIRSRGTFDFSDVHFPGDLRNCEKCHVNDSYELPLPDGLLATMTPKELLPETLPISAACVSCHDSDDAKTHALAQTTFFGESCGACHGEGASFSVEKVHAR
jgi:hypothetical protein